MGCLVYPAKGVAESGPRPLLDELDHREAGALAELEAGVVHDVRLALCVLDVAALLADRPTALMAEADATGPLGPAV